MRNKVLYISVFLVLFALCSASAQKSIVSLLPSSDTELKLYNMEADTFEAAKSSSVAAFSDDSNHITPKINTKRRSSGEKERRLYQLIGSVCMKEWSSGLIRLFRLPQPLI